jgi:hypothetical protein
MTDVQTPARRVPPDTAPAERRQLPYWSATFGPLARGLRLGPPGMGKLYYTIAWLLGVMYFSTGFGKFLDVRGFREVLRRYDLYPTWSLWIIAAGMTIIELFIAYFFLTGRGLNPFGLAGSYLISGGGAIVLFIEVLRDMHLSNCGCWGVFWARPLEWYTPLEDVIMVMMTLYVNVKLVQHQRAQRAAVDR